MFPPKQTPETISGSKTLENSLSNSKFSLDDENVLDNSTSSSVQEISTKIKLETDESTNDCNLKGSNNQIKNEIQNSSINDRSTEFSKNKDEIKLDQPSNYQANVTSINSVNSTSTDQLINGNLITSTAGQPSSTNVLTSTLPPNPFLPVGLGGQVPLFDPLFASNSKF